MIETLYTIGHSTRPIDDFIDILKVFGIQTVIDVRTIPKSRHNPQYNGTDLRDALANHQIQYDPMPNLGGLRPTHKDSINTAWKNASFRGFADYMQTPEFYAAVNQLIEKLHKTQSVILCAEAVPWRCHRSLIGDVLIIRGIKVMDIFDAAIARPHSLTPWAQVKGMAITYPGKRDDTAQSISANDRLNLN